MKPFGSTIWQRALAGGGDRLNSAMRLAMLATLVLGFTGCATTGKPGQAAGPVPFDTDGDGFLSDAEYLAAQRHLASKYR